MKVKAIEFALVFSSLVDGWTMLRLADVFKMELKVYYDYYIIQRKMFLNNVSDYRNIKQVKSLYYSKIQSTDL